MVCFTHAIITEVFKFAGVSRPSFELNFFDSFSVHWTTRLHCKNDCRALLLAHFAKHYYLVPLVVGVDIRQWELHGNRVEGDNLAV